MARDGHPRPDGAHHLRLGHAGQLGALLEDREALGGSVHPVGGGELRQSVVPPWGGGGPLDRLTWPECGGRPSEMLGSDEKGWLRSEQDPWGGP